MAKSAKTTEMTADFPTFDASAASDQVRAFAEKGVEQTKELYASVKTNAEQAQKAVEDSVETVRSASKDVSVKALSAMRTNAQAGFDHLEALLGAKSLSEFVELQTSFLRKQAETAMEQAKDFQAVSSKVVEDVTKPAKDAFAKAVKDIKAA